MPYYARRRTRKPYTAVKKRRYYKKKTTGYRRRRKYAPIRYVRPMWKTAVPEKAYVRFKYNDTGFDGSLSVGNGYFARHVFRGNSPYDPDYTGIGIQPYGWDEYTTFYGVYRAQASSIKVYYHASTEAGKLPKINVRVFPYKSAAAFSSDPADLVQSKYMKGRALTDGTDSNKLRVTNYCSTKRLYGTTAYNDNNFTADMTNNPNADFQWYWHVIFETYDWAINCTIYFDVKITYYCILTEPQMLSKS